MPHSTVSYTGANADQCLVREYALRGIEALLRKAGVKQNGPFLRRRAERIHDEYYSGDFSDKNPRYNPNHH